MTVATGVLMVEVTRVQETDGVDMKKAAGDKEVEAMGWEKVAGVTAVMG